MQTTKPLGMTNCMASMVTPGVETERLSTLGFFEVNHKLNHIQTVHNSTLAILDGIIVLQTCY